MHGIFGALRRMSATAVLVLLAGSAAAQSAYPNKTIRFITPFPPGGNTNILARLVADKLGEALGQTVVVENRPGGNTMIGTDAVAKAAPDGYTILVTTNAHAVTPLLVQAPYDAVKSFAPIAMISRGEWVLVVHPSVPANNLRELIALAKSKPDELNFASSGGGGASHLATELLGTMAGIKMRHVPYKGGGPALPDLIAGRVQLTLAVPSAVVQHIATGRLKAIAISGETRLPALPDVPTFTESGLPGFDAGYWIGALAPAGTPAAVLDKLAAEIGKILATAESKDKLASVGALPFTTTREQFAAVLRNDADKFGNVIKAANIKLE